MSEHDEAARIKVIELVKDIPIAMLSTRGPDGHFHSRPMAPSDASFDGTLYFLTDVSSGKIHDLAAESETLVTFSDHRAQTYVALRGRGAITTDRAAIRDHWSTSAKGWFPKGPDDPAIALIAVAIEDAEYWDVPSGRMVVLYAQAKAAVTGRPAGTIGENERVSMR